MTLEHIVCHVEFLDAKIAAYDQRVGELTQPQAAALTCLDAIPGIGRGSAKTILAELGDDMRCFPGARHAALGTGLCPGNHESAGNRLSGRTRPANASLCQALVEAARGAVVKRDSDLAAQYRRLVTRRWDKRAIVAVAQSVLVTAYHLLRDGTNDADLGAQYFDRLNIVHLTRYHSRCLSELGYTVTLAQSAAWTSGERYFRRIDQRP